MSGYAGHRRRAGRRIGTRDRQDRRTGASGHRRGRNPDGPMRGRDPSRGDLTMVGGRDLSRDGRITVEDLDRRRGGLTMVRGRGHSRDGLTMVEDLDPNPGGLTMARERGHSRAGLTMARERDPNRAGRATAHRPNPGNRMAGRDRNRRGLKIVRDRSRAGRVVEGPRMGRRVSARVVPIRGLRAPTSPTNVSHRLSSQVSIGSQITRSAIRHHAGW
jgi:hypothetical protein